MIKTIDVARLDHSHSLGRETNKNPPPSPNDEADHRNSTTHRPARARPDLASRSFLTWAHLAGAPGQKCTGALHRCASAFLFWRNSQVRQCISGLFQVLLPNFVRPYLFHTDSDSRKLGLYFAYFSETNAMAYPVSLSSLISD